MEEEVKVDPSAEMMFGSQRRAHLGVGVTHSTCDKRLGILDVNDNELLGSGSISGSDCWRMLRRSKQFLSMRVVTRDLVERLDYRREWNLKRPVVTVLDLFPSLKYSYSSLCGRKFGDDVLISRNSKNTRVVDIARSHSIRLDPVEAPKELFKYRCRIKKIIGWAYANNLVPVLMTLTIFHRWHPLDSLCRVLGGAWSEFFRGPQGVARKRLIGLRGYVRRMEETFNDGDSGFNELSNAGWHPHYHVILLIPRDKLTVLSESEVEFRNVWVRLVCKYFFKEFGVEIPTSYLPSLYEHGLVFSRFESSEQARRYGCRHAKAGDLFEVKDGFYLAKLFGVDSHIYGIDSELTMNNIKQSKTPFDLLRGAVTANAVDLWCEYALATKKLSCFVFSHGLKSEVDSFFDSLRGASVESELCSCGDKSVVVRLKSDDYRWLYRHFCLGDFFDRVGRDVVSAVAWLKDSFGIEAVVERSEEVSGDGLSSGGSLEYIVAEAEKNSRSFQSECAKQGATKLLKNNFESESSPLNNFSTALSQEKFAAPPQKIIPAEQDEQKFAKNSPCCFSKSSKKDSENKRVGFVDSDITLSDLTNLLQPCLTSPAKDALAIGRLLLLAKSKQNRGQWLKWLDQSLHLKPRSAQNFMAVYERFSEFDWAARLTSTQLTVLLSLPSGAEKIFVARLADDKRSITQMSVRQLQNAIRSFIAEWLKPFSYCINSVPVDERASDCAFEVPNTENIFLDTSVSSAFLPIASAIDDHFSAASDESARRKIIKTLMKCILQDDANFSKTRFLKLRLKENGFKSVTQVSLQFLYKLLRDFLVAFPELVNTT